MTTPWRTPTAQAAPGPVADQAQLHGILARLHNIGATLLSFHALDGNGTSDRRSNPSTTD